MLTTKAVMEKCCFFVVVFAFLIHGFIDDGVVFGLDNGLALTPPSKS